MKIIVDSREQKPFTFTENARIREGGNGEKVLVEKATLVTGDYSLEGFTDRVAVERKSLDDLIHCLGRERPRFERGLVRSMELEAFCVVCEGSWEQIAKHRYKSQLKPHSACQSIHAFMLRYGCHFTMAGSRKFAEYCTWSFLRHYLRGAGKRNSQKALPGRETVEIAKVIESAEIMEAIDA